MNATELSLLQRIALAFVAFFLILFRRDFALRVAQARAEPKALAPGVPARPPGEPARAPSAEAPPAPPALERPPAAERTAIQVLYLLKREGRLVGFVEDEFYVTLDRR